MSAWLPKHRVPTKALMAFRVALRYGNRIPMPEELQRDFALSRQQSFRMVRAMREALRAEANNATH